MARKSAYPLSDQMRNLNDWFRMMFSEQSKVYRELVGDEEMYFSDVEGTRTQFTKNQLSAVKEKYDIPLSTKISWAIIEQCVSFLTGAKPYPRLIAPTMSQQEWTITYEKLVNATWAESGANDELRHTIQDGLVVGRGWIRVRENNFYTESTFNVIVEYVDWRRVYVDPHSVKPDYSDAEWMCYADYIPRGKAEKIYGLTISDEEADYWGEWGDNIGVETIGDLFPYYSSGKTERYKKYVWVREFFNKKDISVYVSENGDVAKTKPRPKEIPNPDKAALGQQIEQMRMQLQQATAQLEDMAGAAEQAVQTTTLPGQGGDDSMNDMVGANRDYEQASSAVSQQVQQFQALQQQYATMPDTVVAYDFETITGEQLVVREISKTTKKLITRYLCIGNRIVEQSVLPTDEYPLIPFTISQARKPNKVYGMMHYIKDLVKALNKFWALMIYDMQVNASRKVLSPKGAIIDKTQAEQDWSRPDAWIEYEPDSNLPNGGKPEVIPPAPLNPALVQMVQMLQQMIEYITGISTVVMGQATPATPDSFGGIQTLQTFGTQRIKLYARSLETTIEKLVYVMVCYLQAYAPKDKVLTYLDDDGNQEELMVMSVNEDLRFKVKVNMASNLPTQRHMAAQLLGVISGQTKNPHVADLLTQYALEFSDMPESKKMRQELDVVKQQASQLEQLGSQAQDMQAENNQLKQQLFQKDLEMQKQIQEMKLQLEAKLQTQAIRQAATEEQVQQQMGEAPPPPEPTSLI